MYPDLNILLMPLSTILFTYCALVTVTVSFSIRFTPFFFFCFGVIFASILNCRAVVSDSLNRDPDTDPDPAFQVNPDPIRIQGFDDQKLKKKIQMNTF